MPRITSFSQKSLSTPALTNGVFPKRIFENPSILTDDGFGRAVVNDKYIIISATSYDVTVGLTEYTSVGRAYKFDIKTGQLLHTFDNPGIAGDFVPTFSGAVFGLPMFLHKNKLYISSREREPLSNTAQWGAVYVFDVETNELLETITNPELTSDSFGSSIHAVDDYVIIGAYFWDAPGDIFNAGRAYVFNTSDWSIKHTLTAPVPEFNAFFGNASAISNDYIVVAAYAEDTGSEGTVYVLDTETASTVYTLNSPNKGISPNVSSEFGRSVALSGKYLAVGAPEEDYGGVTGQGRVFVYDLTTGSLAYTLNNPNSYDTAAEDGFGFQVSANNDILVVGATFEDSNLGTGSGAIHVYKLSTGELIESIVNPSREELNNKQFGISIDVYRDNLAISEIAIASAIERTYYYKLRGLVPRVPSYTFATTSVNEGIVNDIVFNISNIDYKDGTELFWTIANNAAEFDLPISGNFIINNNTGVIPVKPRADATTEGTETFTVEVRANTGVRQVVAVSDPITINDTSQDPTYTLSSSRGLVVNEGETFIVSLETTDVPDGTVIPYTIISSPTGTSITALDLSAGTMAGTFTINNNLDTVTFSIASDEITEGNEYLYLALNNGEAAIDIRISDTSTYPVQWVDAARDVVILASNNQLGGLTPSRTNGPFPTVKSINVFRVPGLYTGGPTVSGLNFSGGNAGVWTLSFWVNGLGFPTINTEYPFLTLVNTDNSGEITIGYFPNPSQGNSGRLGLRYGTPGNLFTLNTPNTLFSGWSNIVVTYNSFDELELHLDGFERAQANNYNFGTIDTIIYGGRGTVNQVTGDPTAPADFEIAEVVLAGIDNFGARPNAGTFTPDTASVVSYARGLEVVPTDKIYQVYATDDVDDPTNNAVTAINETTNNSVSFSVVCTNVTTDNGAPITVSWSLNGISASDIASIDGLAVNSAADLSGTLDILNLDAGYVGNFITVVVRDDREDEADDTEIMTLNIGATDSEGDQTGSPSASVTIADTGVGPIDERNLLQSYSQDSGYYLGTFTDPTTGQSYALIGDSAVGLEFSYNDWDTDGIGSFDTQPMSSEQRFNNGEANSYAYFDSTDYPLVYQFTSATLNNFADWYLPSINEAELIATLAKTVDLGDQSWPNRTRGYTTYGQPNTHFITSTEADADNVYYVDLEKEPYIVGGTIPKNGKRPTDYIGTVHAYYAIRRVPISRNLNPTFTVANNDFISSEYEIVGADRLIITVDVTQMHVMSYAMIPGGSSTWSITLTNTSEGYTRQLICRGYSSSLSGTVSWSFGPNPRVLFFKSGSSTADTPLDGETFDTIQLTKL